MPGGAVPMRPAGDATSPPSSAGGRRARARDLGIAIGVLPTGPGNAITDVPGVLVGHCTVSWGDSSLPSGRGPARTGVTAVLAHGGDLFHERVRAGVFAANGVGEIVGSTPIREWGLIETPILLTNSQSVGVAYDATVRWMMARDPRIGIEDVAMPVVGECDDSMLNDARGMHVLPEHVQAALDSASAGPVAEGCVGAGTGMVCFDFKGGIGTSSRVVHALRRAVHARRAGPHELRGTAPPRRGRGAGRPRDRGPHAARAPRGLLHRGLRHGRSALLAPVRASRQALLARVWPSPGPARSDSSGEIMLAFTTAARLPRTTSAPLAHVRVGDDAIDQLFEAAVDATAEAVVNSLCAAVTTDGRDGKQGLRPASRSAVGDHDEIRQARPCLAGRWHNKGSVTPAIGRCASWRRDFDDAVAWCPEAGIRSQYVHQGAHQRHPGARPDPQTGAHHPRRRDAEPDRDPLRLPLPPALPGGDGRVLRDDPVDVDLGGEHYAACIRLK